MPRHSHHHDRGTPLHLQDKTTPPRRPDRPTPSADATLVERGRGAHAEFAAAPDSLADDPSRFVERDA